jgi:uncharacterized membrane protein YkoI
MQTKTIAILALAGLLAGAIAAPGYPGYAASHDESREATALQSAKVTLPQAIAIAEQQTGGRAYDAGVDIKAGATRIAVETNGPKGVLTVIVDAQSGKVVGTHPGPEQD